MDDERNPVALVHRQQIAHRSDHIFIPSHPQDAAAGQIYPQNNRVVVGLSALGHVQEPFLHPRCQIWQNRRLCIRRSSSEDAQVHAQIFSDLSPGPCVEFLSTVCQTQHTMLRLRDLRVLVKLRTLDCGVELTFWQRPPAERSILFAVLQPPSLALVGEVWLL